MPKIIPHSNNVIGSPSGYDRTKLIIGRSIRIDGEFFMIQAIGVSYAFFSHNPDMIIFECNKGIVRSILGDKQYYNIRLRPLTPKKKRNEKRYIDDSI